MTVCYAGNRQFKRFLRTDAQREEHCNYDKQSLVPSLIHSIQAFSSFIILPFNTRKDTKACELTDQLLCSPIRRQGGQTSD